MRVLAIDAGFTLGYGFLASGKKHALSGSWTIKGGSEQMGEAFRSVRKVFLGLIEKDRPDVIVTAMPFIGRLVSPVQLRPIFGFDCLIQDLADEYGIRFERIREVEARKAFIGGVPRKSKDIKAAVIGECRSRGWPACDSHAADALCVASYMLDKLEPARSHERTPLFVRRIGRRRVAA